MSASADIPAAPQRHPLLELLAIAAPVVATMTSYTVMQFVDKLMVSRIGPDPIYVGAQGNGGLIAFVLISIMMGFVTVINTYVSQNLGAGRPERAPAYAWTGVWMSVFYWALLLVPFALVLPWVFDAIRETPMVADAAVPTVDQARLDEFIRRDSLAVGYGRILLLGAVITMACRAISQYFYGMHKPMVVLFATVAGNITNLVGNSLLIYGPDAPASTGIGVIDSWFAFTAGAAQSFNIPRLGLDGAGYATVLGTCVELTIPLAVFLSPGFNRRFQTLASWRPSLSHMRDIYRIGWPGAIMFGNEMVCWSFFMVYLVGKFGPLHSTAGWIAHQWMSLSFMPTVGISVAATATIGKCMGMKRPDLAAQRAWLSLGLAVTYMTLCGICFVLFRREMVGLFVQQATPAADATLLIALGSQFLVAVAAFQFFDGIAMSLSGALRGAGDTRWPGVVTVLLSWTVIVGGGLAFVEFAPHLGSLGPWIAAAVYITLLAIAVLYRWTGGKWKSINLLGDSAAVTQIEAKPGDPTIASPAAPDARESEDRIRA